MARIATRPIVDQQGIRRTVPAWQAPRTVRTGGLADWLAARRNPKETGHA